MTWLPLALLILLLLAATVEDIRRRIIPNRLNMAIALSAPAMWIAQDLPLWPAIATQVLAAAIVFALFAALFAAGLMGGGDVKLAGAVALWLPWRDSIDLIVLTALLGGGVTLATLLVHRWRQAPGAAEVPYGVAIAGAAFLCIGERYLYHSG